MKTNLTNCSIALATVVFVVLGCNAIKDGKPLAEKGVAEFHDRLNHRKFDEIYDTSHDGFKALASREELAKIASAVRTKLGRVVDTKNQTWNVKTFNLLTTVTLLQKTTFENGEGDEQFVFAIENGKAVLYGWHINSMDLITK